MRWLFTIILLIGMLGTANAADHFPKGSVEWKTSTRVNRVIRLKSRWPLDNDQVRLFRSVYRDTKRLFHNHYDGFIRKCDALSVDVMVISRTDLSNKEYFPGEDKYSIPGETVIGRYFRSKNTLYIVYPDKPIWKRDFAHELLHYFYDDCNAYFPSSTEEHRAIDQVLNFNH